MSFVIIIGLRIGWFVQDSMVWMVIFLRSKPFVWTLRFCLYPSIFFTSLGRLIFDERNDSAPNKDKCLVNDKARRLSWTSYVCKKIRLPTNYCNHFYMILSFPTECLFNIIYNSLQSKSFQAYFAFTQPDLTHEPKSLNTVELGLSRKNFRSLEISYLSQWIKLVLSS